MKQVKGVVMVVTAAFVVSLALLVGSSMASIQKQTEANCFRYLDGATHRLADDLLKTTQMDRTILTAMASIIANEHEDSNSGLCDIMNSYRNSSYISYIELLRADNTMLDSDGTVREVGSLLDFEAESARGAYVSDIEFSSKDPSVRIIRHAVPVLRNGQTIYMLYGVVVLTDFAKTYTTNIYDGNVYVYLEDGNTGDFLLDTWHKSFGNISDFFDRRILSTGSFRDAAADMQNGVAGDLSFVSQSTGDTLYLHHEPVGVNNWNVIVTVQEQYAMADSEAVSGVLYRMASIAGTLIFAYMLFIITLLLRAYRSIRKIGLNDQITGLPNRNAYDAFVAKNEERVFELLGCVYLDVNGLHELNNTSGHEAGDRMLRSVAEALKKEFSGRDVFRAGGDEFVVIAEGLEEECCTEKAARVNQALAEQGYSVAYGVSVQRRAMGCESTIHEADEKMLEHKKLYYRKHDRRSRE